MRAWRMADLFHGHYTAWLCNLGFEHCHIFFLIRKKLSLCIAVRSLVNFSGCNFLFSFLASNNWLDTMNRLFLISLIRSLFDAISEAHHVGLQIARPISQLTEIFCKIVNFQLVARCITDNLIAWKPTWHCRWFQSPANCKSAAVCWMT